VLGEFVVSAATIHERCSGLALRSGNKPSRVTRGIEDEGTNTREDEGIESENAVRRRHHESTCGLVHISLHTERAGGSEILLRVPGVTVTGVSGQPAIEVIPIAEEKATGVCRMLIDPVSARILRKETSSLDANFLPAPFLSHRFGGAYQDRKNHCNYNFPDHISLAPPCWISFTPNSIKQALPTN
jgi:hypothetical protein